MQLRSIFLLAALSSAMAMPLNDINPTPTLEERATAAGGLNTAASILESVAKGLPGLPGAILEDVAAGLKAGAGPQAAASAAAANIMAGED